MTNGMAFLASSASSDEYLLSHKLVSIPIAVIYFGVLIFFVKKYGG